MDNSNVFPYSPHLLMSYQAHVNTEYCNKSNSIKYLFKYVNKRSDRATMKIINGSTQDVDEINNYYDCRYLSLCEVVWRTFGFDIHHRWLVVQKLSFHLPKQQSIMFKDDDNLDQVFQNNESMKTMFLGWKPRKQCQNIGRLTYVPPGSGEFYYMRILLTIQKGYVDYTSIRTVNGQIFNTYEEALMRIK